MGRAPCCSKVGLHRGPWTAREDHLLMKYIESHGEGHWRALPKKAGLLRCGKSCRLRWMNYLRPDIKRGNISSDEEELIIRLHSLLGNRWSLIAGRLPGRTDNEIKNFWNTHLSKKLMRKGIDPKTHKPLSKNINSGRTKFDDEDPKQNDRGLRTNELHSRPKKEVQANAGPRRSNVHLPKANRYIAFPLVRNRQFNNPNTEEGAAGLDLTELIFDESPIEDGLELSPSIDLNSPNSIASFDTASQESDSPPTAAIMSPPLSPVSHNMCPEILTQQANSDDYNFPWECLEDWSLTCNLAQSTLIKNVQDGNPIQSNQNVDFLNSSTSQIEPSAEAKSVYGVEQDNAITANNSGPSGTVSAGVKSKSAENRCSNMQLQKVYEEYLELLLEDHHPLPSCTYSMAGINANVEELHVFSEDLSPVWDCLEECDNQQLLSDHQPHVSSETLTLHL